MIVMAPFTAWVAVMQGSSVIAISAIVQLVSGYSMFRSGMKIRDYRSLFK